jgi:hypothetical protein
LLLGSQAVKASIPLQTSHNISVKMNVPNAAEAPLETHQKRLTGHSTKQIWREIHSAFVRPATGCILLHPMWEKRIE